MRWTTRRRRMYRLVRDGTDAQISRRGIVG
jgi:hypothetical protein